MVTIFFLIEVGYFFMGTSTGNVIMAISNPHPCVLCVLAKHHLFSLTPSFLHLCYKGPFLFQVMYYEQCHHFILSSTQSKAKLLALHPFSNDYWQANVKLMICNVLFTQLAASVRGCLFL